MQIRLYRWNSFCQFKREICVMKGQYRGKSGKCTWNPTEVQEQVLIGTLLGDGCLAKKGRNCRLHVKHSIGQLPFVEWKREMFKDITSMNINVFEQEVVGKNYGFCQFATKTHPFFTEYRDIFYEDGRKRIPSNIQELLSTPLALATWFMDDGTRSCQGLTLQTNCFEVEEVELLQTVLLNNFEIKTTSKDEKGRRVIYVLKNMVPKFRSLVEPHMLPSMLYKFP